MARPCVVLDIDDTLYLESSYVASGFAAVGDHVQQRHGVDGFGERAWALFEAGHRNSTFDTVAAELGLPSAVVPELIECYRNHRPTIAPLDDASAAIERLRPVADLAAISDGPLASQQAKAEALGVFGWSAATILTAELGPGKSKPAPDGYREVERRLPGASGYAYVADNPKKDFVAPRQLGWRTVRVRRPGSLHAAADSGDDVDIEVSDLREIETALWP